MGANAQVRRLDRQLDQVLKSMQWECDCGGINELREVSPKVFRMQCGVCGKCQSQGLTVKEI